MLRFIRFDVRAVLQQIAQLVETLDHTDLVEGIDGEADAAAVGQQQRLAVQIDGLLHVRFLGGQADQLLVGVVIDDERQQPVLQRVVAKDVGE